MPKSFYDKTTFPDTHRHFYPESKYPRRFRPFAGVLNFNKTTKKANVLEYATYESYLGMSMFSIYCLLSSFFLQHKVVCLLGCLHECVRPSLLDFLFSDPLLPASIITRIIIVIVRPLAAIINLKWLTLPVRCWLFFVYSVHVPSLPPLPPSHSPFPPTPPHPSPFICSWIS